MKNILPTALLLLLLVLGGCNLRSGKPAVSNAPQPTAYAKTGVVKNYELFIPEGWSVKDTVLEGVRFHFLFAPKKKAEALTSINITHDQMHQLTLEEYTYQTILSMKQHLPGFEVLEEDSIANAGLKGHWFHYKVAPYNKPAELINYTFSQDNVAYTLTATTDVRNMPAYRKTFDKVAMSFKLKNQ